MSATLEITVDKGDLRNKLATFTGRGTLNYAIKGDKVYSVHLILDSAQQFTVTAKAAERISIDAGHHSITAEDANQKQKVQLGRLMKNAPGIIGHSIDGGVKGALGAAGGIFAPVKDDPSVMQFDVTDGELFKIFCTLNADGTVKLSKG